MLEKVRELLAQKKLDALFVTNQTNIFYLTGFKGSNGFVLLTKNHLYLLTDGRYLEKAEKTVSDECRVIDISPGLFNQIHILLAKHRVKSFGIESTDISYAFFLKLDSLNGFKIHQADEIMQTVRAIKSEKELRALRKTQKLNQLALKMLLDEIKVKVTETELAWKLQLIVNDLGADKFSFDPIIAFGAHSSRPHHESSAKKKLRKGDVILVDMGVTKDYFCSDLTRTFFTKPPTSEQRNVYQTVLDAYHKAAAELKPGVLADEVDKAARKTIHHAGFIKKFPHATGHGVGMDVHEFPRVAKGAHEELKEGMVITIEPGIYLPGKFGVRLEDMFEVKKDSKSVLGSFPLEIDSAICKIR